MKLHMEKCLVGVDHFFERNVLPAVEYEWRCRIILFINLPVAVFGQSLFRLCIYACEYAACEISSHGHEIDTWLNPVAGLMCKTFLYFGQVLVREQLIYGHVAAPVAEMRGLSRLFSCSRRTCDGRNMDFVLNQPGLCQGEQGKLYGSCKASRIGYVVSLAYFLPLHFRTVRI